MKNIFLLLVLFLSVGCFAQPHPPTPKDKLIKENPFGIAVNYGTENTLTFELTKESKHTVYGIGGGLYIGRNDGKPLSEGYQYVPIGLYYIGTHTEVDKALYFVYGKRFNSLTVKARIGTKLDAKFLNYNYDDDPGTVDDFTYTDYYYAKEQDGYKLLVGGSLNYTSKSNTGVSIGWDNFSKFTVGVFILI